MDRQSILQEAALLVTGDRKEVYGSAEESFKRIANLWAAYLGVNVSAHDVALMMALLKISRAKGAPSHQDSYVDLAGYAALAGEISV